MDDLISRQAAIDALFSLRYTPGEWAVKGFSMCVDAIKNLPSAQPELIMCKDCKFADRAATSSNGMYWCIFHGSYMRYCSDAERKTDE